MLSNTDVAEVRDALAIIFHDSGSILRSGSAADGFGGWSGSTVVSGSMLCSVKPSGNMPVEREIAEKLSSESLYTVSMPANTDITERDRLQVAIGIPTPVVRTFEVVAVLAPTWEFVRKVVAKEVT